MRTLCSSNWSLHTDHMSVTGDRTCCAKTGQRCLSVFADAAEKYYIVDQIELKYPHNIHRIWELRDGTYLWKWVLFYVDMGRNHMQIFF